MNILILLLFSALALAATQAEANPAKIDLPFDSTYPTLSAAYLAAADGATILLHETVLTEDIILNETKSVTLTGGYSTDFSQNTGMTTLQGILRISGGTVRVSNLLLRMADTPPVPTGVTATLGNSASTVVIRFDTTSGSTNAATGYTVSSVPPGLTVSGTASPITVTCPTACSGYSFSVVSTNVYGNSAPSAAADVITEYSVIETFYEPDTQPNNSIFVGSFTLNSTTAVVSNLHGILSESMTCIPGECSLPYPNDTMNWLSLNNQLVSWHDQALGGTFAAVFRNSDTRTFSLSVTDQNTGITTVGDGWSPQWGVNVGGVFYGFPTVTQNPGNAYALVFVPDDPTAPLTQEHLNKLAYADCAPDGMMGPVCMTGTAVVGYGASGTMGGYPDSQIITKK